MMFLDASVVKQRLQQLFTKHHIAWLSGNGKWPLVIDLGLPDQKTALANIPTLIHWTAQWQQWQGVGQLHWRQCHWSALGQQQLPEKIVFFKPDEIIEWLEQKILWQQINNRYQLLIKHWPQLTQNVKKYYEILTDYSEINFEHLLHVLDWILQHPDSQLYQRQLPVAGIDSKWLEIHKKTIFELLKLIKAVTTEQDFYAVTGLKQEPKLIRLRILDAALRKKLQGLSDLCATSAELAQLNFFPRRVYIVENLRTGLAFTDLSDAVVFIGLGYGVSQLCDIPWIHTANCYYWGDLDTHGFAILNLARQYFPHIQSLFMDQQTLFAAKLLWGKEEKPCRLEQLPHLTDAEHVVYDNLRHNVWGYQIRLEQERIFWQDAWQVLSIPITPQDARI